MTERTTSPRANATNADATYPQFEARLADMEMRIAFQDDLMTTLNDQVANQERAMQRLWDTNRLLREQIENLRDPQQRSEPDQEPPPPHY